MNQEYADYYRSLEKKLSASDSNKHVISQIQKELQVGSVDQIFTRIKKLTSNKDTRLVANLKNLVRDFKSQSHTIDVSDKSMLTLLNEVSGETSVSAEETLPSAKEVWRWIKALLQQYI